MLGELDVMIQLNNMEAHRRNCADCCDKQHKQDPDGDDPHAIPDVDVERGGIGEELSSMDTEYEEVGWRAE